jgi:4-oxalocrotonate tautomerase
MPYIDVRIYKGRSIETKRAFVEAVTKACTDILGSSAESVHILFDELDYEDVGQGGIYPRVQKKTPTS